jgi:hypothetical protein
MKVLPNLSRVSMLALMLALVVGLNPVIPVFAGTVSPNQDAASGFQTGPATDPLAQPADAAVSDDWWSQVRQEIIASEYYVTWQDWTYLPDLPAAYQAPNRAHNLRTYFASHGPIVIPRVWPEEARAAPWRWQASLVAWGRAGALQPLPSAELSVQDSRIQYQRVGAAPSPAETYHNGEGGLEQAFTLSVPPPDSPQDAPVQLDLALGGDLVPNLEPGGAGLQFLDPEGEPALLYGALAATDATGRDLPLSLSLEGSTLSLSIDDSDAAYPIQVGAAIAGLPDTDNWNLTWGTGNTQFGHSVATAGSVNCDRYSDIVVGAPYYDGGRTDQGRVMVFYGSAAGIDPSHTIAWDKLGAQDDALFGFSVAAAGDVNGDGCGDIIVGAPEYDHPEENEGGAWVYHGSDTGVVDAPAFFAQSNQAHAQLGYSVSTAGDVNGEEGDHRYADVIVGAWLYNHPETSEGAAFIWHGSTSGVNGGANGTPSNADWMAEANQDHAWMGVSVSTAGDVNGDGYADVIIGASSYTHGNTNEGAVFIWHGSASGVNNGTDGNPTNDDWWQDSDQAEASLGRAVSTAGDVNGDGYADVIVGAHRYTEGQSEEGAAWLYLGSSTGVLPTWDNMDQGNSAGAWLGFSVATAGDVNGDGYADVIVGAPRRNNDQSLEGQAYIWHGSADGISETRDWWAEGNGTEALYGASVATAGDVNGDGYSDIVVGAPGDNSHGGTVRAYYGSPVSLEETATWVKRSNDPGAQFGFSVSTAGDVNGDGYADVLVGAPFWLDEGAAWVYLGQEGGIDEGPPAWYMPSGQTDCQFGHSVGSAGDVNGDGLDDVVVGAPNWTKDHTGEGAAFVYLATGADPPVSTSAQWAKRSNQGGAHFGFSVGTAGDVNGDGYADIVVGAPDWNGNGAVWVYEGSDTGTHSAPDWHVPSTKSGAGYGFSVGTAGDVNADGYSDVIVGAPYWEDDANVDEGRVWVYHGSSAGLSTTHSWHAEANNWTAHMGYSAGTAGDVNGDGYSDVIVGAPDYGDGGRVWVFYGTSSGVSSSGAWSRESGQGGAWYGYSVGTAGDVNGDGRADILIGAPHMTGSVFDEGLVRLYLGSPSGVSSSYDWTDASGQTLSYYGRSVGTAGDVNGDGYAEAIIGAPEYNDVYTNEGRAYVYFGNGGQGVSLRPRQQHPGGAPLAHLGRSSDMGSFRARLRAGTPFGRGRILLECEVKPVGTPFTGSDVQVWGDYQMSVPGNDKYIVPHDLAADTPHHWRVRWRYDPVTTPWMPAGRWVTLPWNGWNETDFRAGGSRTVLPVVLREYLP